jgi:hypothetical protein
MIVMDELPKLLRQVEQAQREHDQLVGEHRALLKSLKDQFGYSDEDAAALGLEKEKAKELAEYKLYAKELQAFEKEFGGVE